MNKLELSKVRDFGELIGDSILFLKQNFKPLFKSLFVICGIFILASAVASGIMQGDMMTPEYQSNPFGKIFSSQFGTSVLFSYAAYILVGLTTFCYMSVYKEKGNQPANVDEVWSFVKYFFWQFVGGSIVGWICLVVGFVLCLLPGFYLLPIVSLMLAAIVFENAGVGYVIDRSFKLIKNEWWTTFGAIMVVGILVYAAMMVVILPFTILGGVLTALSTAGQSGNFSPFMILISVLSHLGYFFMTLSYIVVGLAYFSLVEKKEGTSLLSKVDNIGTKQFSDDLPEEEY